MLKICLRWSMHMFEDNKCYKYLWVNNCCHTSVCALPWLLWRYVVARLCIVSGASRTVPWIHILMRLKSGLQFRMQTLFAHTAIATAFFLTNLWTNLYIGAPVLAHPMKYISRNFRGGLWTWTIPAFRKVQLWDEWVRWSWYIERKRKSPRMCPGLWK